MDEIDADLACSSLKAQQTAQMLITAGFLDDYHLPRLVDEALDDDGPEAITASLMGFLEANTSRVPFSENDGRGMLDYVVRSACRALHDLAHQRGGDPHEFIRSQLSAASSTVDEYHGVAQILLVTAFLPVERTALYEQTLEIAAPAYRRVSSAVLDLWFTAALDALPTSAWCVIKPLLESCVEIIRGLAQYAGCEPEQMLTTYWISLEDARA